MSPLGRAGAPALRAESAAPCCKQGGTGVLNHLQTSADCSSSKTVFHSGRASRRAAPGNPLLAGAYCPQTLQDRPRALQDASRTPFWRSPAASRSILSRGQLSGRSTAMSLLTTIDFAVMIKRSTSMPLKCSLEIFTPSSMLSRMIVPTSGRSQKVWMRLVWSFRLCSCQNIVLTNAQRAFTEVFGGRPSTGVLPPASQVAPRAWKQALPDSSSRTCIRLGFWRTRSSL